MRILEIDPSFMPPLHFFGGGYCFFTYIGLDLFGAALVFDDNIFYTCESDDLPLAAIFIPY